VGHCATLVLNFAVIFANLHVSLPLFSAKHFMHFGVLECFACKTKIQKCLGFVTGELRKVKIADQTL